MCFFRILVIVFFGIDKVRMAGLYLIWILMIVLVAVDGVHVAFFVVNLKKLDLIHHGGTARGD